jgi:hypothetical protein
MRHSLEVRHREHVRLRRFLLIGFVRRSMSFRPQISLMSQESSWACRAGGEPQIPERSPHHEKDDRRS